MEWQLTITRPRRFGVTAEIAAAAGVCFTLAAAGEELSAKAPQTGDYKRFQAVKLGALTIAAPGKTSLAVRPVAAGWRPMSLRSITPRPAKK